MDVQYLLFCFCWDAEHTILDFLTEFELIIVYELTLCGILVLFSLHLLLYAWVLNLVILYHIFFANLNHLCTWFFNQQHTLSFYTSVICMDMKLILCVSRILSRISFFVIFQKHFLFMFLPLFNDFFSTNMQISWFFTDWIKNSRVRLCLFQSLIFCFTDSFFQFKTICFKIYFLNIHNHLNNSYGHCWGSIYYSATSFYRYTLLTWSLDKELKDIFHQQVLLF